MIMEYIMNTFIVILLVFVIVLIGGVGYEIYQDYNSPTFTLKKNEWQCTATESHNETSFIMVGKVMVPITNIVTNCTEWNKK